MTAASTPGRPTTRDTPTLLPEWENLQDALTTHHVPCHNGIEWISPRPTDQRRAARMCQPCQARTECAAYALAAGETTAVWGGLTPAELQAQQRGEDAAA